MKQLHKKIDQLNDKFNDIKKSVQKWESEAEGKIKEHPVQSVLISFGAGILAGAIISALISRRR